MTPKVSVSMGTVLVGNKDFVGYRPSYPTVVKQSIEEALEWHSHQTCLPPGSRSEFFDRIQDVILSRMYSNRVQKSNNYHWNIVISELYPEAEEEKHCLFTNHQGLIDHSKNKTETVVSENGETETLTHIHLTGIELNFYCSTTATFNV